MWRGDRPTGRLRPIAAAHAGLAESVLRLHIGWDWDAQHG